MLKEPARNVVQHRRYDATNGPARVTWFDDRIESSNPGGRFGAASEGEFGEHSDYRNPTTTARLAEQGYVQRLGRGTCAPIRARSPLPGAAETFRESCAAGAGGREADIRSEAVGWHRWRPSPGGAKGQGAIRRTGKAVDGDLTDSVEVFGQNVTLALKL
jgi:hypothetical protein